MRHLPILLLLAACQSSWDIQDLDGDGFTLLEGDCDDANADIKPDAVEICDGLDNDCDGTADGPGTEGIGTWLPDDDRDGYGDDDRAVVSCDQPAGTITQGGDCDDTVAAKHPGLDETCDGLDNDCNDLIDDDPIDGDPYYEDRDRDGFGDPERLVRGCTQPANTTGLAEALDCEDDDATAYPNSTATEVPGDGVDQDCDGLDVCTDLTCDGLPDLIVANHRLGSVYDQPIWVFAGTPDRSFVETPDITLEAHSVLKYAVHDLDDDGYQDLVWISGQRVGSDAVTIAYGGAGGFPTARRVELAASAPRDLDVVDIDEDGFLDLMVTNYEGDRTFVVESTIYWGGAGGYSSGEAAGLTGTGARAALVADLDDDGLNDVVLCNEQTGIMPSPYVAFSTIYWGRSGRLDGVTATSIQVTGCRDVAAADLNGDGRLDLAFAQWRTRAAAMATSKVVFNDGDRFVGASTTSLTTSAAASVQAADVDSDGRPDLIFGVDASVDEDWERPWSVHFNGPTGLGSGRTTLQLTGSDVRHPAAADLDDDGDIDLVTPGFGTLDGAIQTEPVSLWDNRLDEGRGLGESTLDVGGALRVVPFDVNDDGETDLLFNNAGAGVGGKTYASVYYGADGAFSTARRWRVETRRVEAPLAVVGRWPEPL